jgi:acyl carrier protein
MIILKEITNVFQDVFEDDDLIIGAETTAQDIDDWDSLMHITLVMAVEKTFSIRLTSSEVTKLKNVGDFISLIERKL